MKNLRPEALRRSGIPLSNFGYYIDSNPRGCGMLEIVFKVFAAMALVGVSGIILTLLYDAWWG